MVTGALVADNHPWNEIAGLGCPVAQRHDRAAIARYGLTIDDVQQTIMTAIGGLAALGARLQHLHRRVGRSHRTEVRHTESAEFATKEN